MCNIESAEDRCAIGGRQHSPPEHACQHSECPARFQREVLFARSASEHCTDVRPTACQREIHSERQLGAFGSRRPAGESFRASDAESSHAQMRLVGTTAMLFGSCFRAHSTSHSPTHYSRGSHESRSCGTLAGCLHTLEKPRLADISDRGTLSEIEGVLSGNSCAWAIEASTSWITSRATSELGPIKTASTEVSRRTWFAHDE
mmetsp:Transcript_9958/g.27841  ORF Transcript_9958/g.27841 Transcript_9958/m.27841 type:complete len:203 (-) Transcript_9958:368-976(-)